MEKLMKTKLGKKAGKKAAKVQKEAQPKDKVFSDSQLKKRLGKSLLKPAANKTPGGKYA